MMVYFETDEKYDHLFHLIYGECMKSILINLCMLNKNFYSLNLNNRK